MTSLPTILLILAAISIGAMAIAVLVALRSHREAQSAIFPIVKEEESTRAQRARLSIFIWVAITALFLGGWLATFGLTGPDETNTPGSDIASGQPAEGIVSEAATGDPLAANEPSPTATGVEAEIQPLDPAGAPTNTPVQSTQPALPPEPTPSLPAATPTSEPALTFTPTPVPPTATPSPLPPTATSTATSSPVPPTGTPTPVRIPTSAPRTPAPAGVRMGPIQFAENITPDVEAVNPGSRFRNGIGPIYAVYPFSGMPKDVNFTAIWYKNGVEVDRNEEKWPYGSKGRGFSFLVPRGTGLYKLELWVNDTVVATSLFEVR